MRLITRVRAIKLGLNRYFVGGVCHRGHVAERYVRKGTCCECVKENSTKWRLADPARAARRVKEWIKANSERFRRSRHAYNMKHAAKKKETDRLKYEADPASKQKVNRDWYVANPERTKRYRASWRKANPDKVKVYRRTRRARKRGAEGRHTERDLFVQFVVQDSQCNGCGASLLISCTEDHIIPLSRGGSNWPNNIQLLCLPCNDKKGAKTMEEWRPAP